jgi:hypothetical protein
MSEFESALDTCLEALRESRWDVEECLRRFPERADELRPHLLAAAATQHAFAVEPSEEFRGAARERFLIASGERLREAYDVEPSLSFFASARVKFLMRAHRMRGQRAGAGQRRRGFGLPGFRIPVQALAGAAAVLTLFFGFSTYTVATAEAALPGDWRYPIKLQTERVRLALAFSEEAERNVRLDIAEERAEEIEKLASKGRIIGPGVIGRLADETEPLVEAASEGKLKDSHVDKLNRVTAKAKEALEQADASDQVSPEAQPKLAIALELADRGFIETSVTIIARDSAPKVVTPVIAVESPDPSSTPEPSTTPTPGAVGTPAGPTSPTPTPARIPPESLVVSTPEGTQHGVTWVRLAVGRFSTLVPSSADGWNIAGINPASGPVSAPEVITIANLDATSIISLVPRTGDMFWFVSVNGVFDEVQMRQTRAGQAYISDAELLRRLYGPLAEIPLYVLQNIELVPPPATPTPQATPTAAP